MHLYSNGVLLGDNSCGYNIRVSLWRARLLLQGRHAHFDVCALAWHWPTSSVSSYERWDLYCASCRHATTKSFSGECSDSFKDDTYASATCIPLVRNRQQRLPVMKAAKPAALHGGIQHLNLCTGECTRSSRTANCYDTFRFFDSTDTAASRTAYSSTMSLMDEHALQKRLIIREHH